MHTLTELWNRAAEEHAQSVAAIDAGQQFTYSDLDRMIAGFAGALRRQLGVSPGDRVGLIMPNCVHSISCYLGTVRAGAIALPVNIRLKAEEMAFILKDAGVRSLVVDRRVWPTVWEAVGELEGVTHIIGIDVHQPTVMPLDEVYQHEPLRQSPPASADDVAAIIYTSGTTGLPKGAMITHGNIVFNVQATIAGHGFRPDDRHMLVVPLFHVTGLNTIMPTAFHQGASVVISADANPSVVMKLVAQWRATTFFGVPTTMILLAQTPGITALDWSSLRLIAYSGAPMPVRAIEKLRDLFPGVRLHNFFGLTETTSVTTVLEDEQALARPDSVGRAVPGLQLGIVDDDGAMLPPGQVGELVVKGPSVVKGYYNRPEATQEAIRDGWLHTGDNAYLDDEGYLFLQGRKKEMIIVAGENVYPVEVENVLTRHPAVAEAAVIGAPHAVLGEVVKAVVVLVQGAKADELSIKRHCAQHLASFKTPQIVEFADALPRNPSGKVVKRRLTGDASH